MTRILKIVVLVLALLPGATVCAEVLRLQAKADELYHDGHWERAHFIYVNDLAAIGDKYSQYMAGYMCLHGRGVEQDPIKASAWYRLAAERGSPEFVEVRDELLESLSDEQKAASDAAFLSLRQRYSDVALLLRQLERERRQAQETPTGSRLTGGDPSAVLVVGPYTSTTSLSELKRRQERRLETMIRAIAETLEIEPPAADMNDAEFNRLEQQVEEYLSVIDDR